jgi:lipase
VVCLHGLTGFGGRFRRLTDAALSERRVLAVDLRGHGASGWEPPWDLGTHTADLLETFDALALDRPDLVGHSIGGRLIAELAWAAPDRVGKAVLLDPAMRVGTAVAAERVEILRGDLSFASVDEAVDTRLADPTLFSTPRFMVAEDAPDHLALGEDGRYRWRFSPGMAIVAWSEMTTAPPPWPPGQTLVVVGARSWIELDIPESERLWKVTVPGGHAVLWDAFEETASAIADFLQL